MVLRDAAECAATDDAVSTLRRLPCKLPVDRNEWCDDVGDGGPVGGGDAGTPMTARVVDQVAAVDAVAVLRAEGGGLAPALLTVSAVAGGGSGHAGTGADAIRGGGRVACSLPGGGQAGLTASPGGGVDCAGAAPSREAKQPMSPTSGDTVVPTKASRPRSVSMCKAMRCHRRSCTAVSGNGLVGRNNDQSKRGADAARQLQVMSAAWLRKAMSIHLQVCLSFAAAKGQRGTTIALEAVNVSLRAAPRPAPA